MSLRKQYTGQFKSNVALSDQELEIVFGESHWRAFYGQAQRRRIGRIRL